MNTYAAHRLTCCLLVLSFISVANAAEAPETLNKPSRLPAAGWPQRFEEWMRSRGILAADAGGKPGAADSGPATNP